MLMAFAVACSMSSSATPCLRADGWISTPELYYETRTALRGPNRGPNLHVTQGHDPSLRDELTAQELQIAQLAAEGLSNREIGQKLFVSPRTVSTHLYRIYPKLGISARGQLASALEAG